MTLITRPTDGLEKRLAMNMLDTVFWISGKIADICLKDLEISDEVRDLCSKWMNQYPTLFLSFKACRWNYDLRMRLRFV